MAPKKPPLSFSHLCACMYRPPKPHHGLEMLYGDTIIEHPMGYKEHQEPCFSCRREFDNSTIAFF